ncbi:hypothetical protein DAPPUDRAFT_328485 [Daphnia pulex]|uniref:Uncharacterized protein n=1 Tax=Daphnia pulex TaxID=6669 RepID=E9HDU3_DAPPU|nr:hypothetical protein DAPPUDRAFT_328485 [Daphnia pulex]|eukprot:EFX70085.1 hypothetical protein DAPPUDRAFT_328485 [Daphnia pulex]
MRPQKDTRIIGMVFIVNLGVQLGAGCFGHVVKAEALGLKDSKKKKWWAYISVDHRSFLAPKQECRQAKALTAQTLQVLRSTSLAKWIVTGIKDEKVKACREAFKSTLKLKSEFLVNPTLDESISLRLKASKNSNATKTNIEPTEKMLKKLSYKILDLIKPLLYLASRVNFKEEEEKRCYRN